MLGRAQKHGGVTVMATGMHDALVLRRIGQVAFLVDRQRIHVGAQPDPAITAALALDQAHDAGLGDPGMDLVHAIFAQLFCHHLCSACFGKSDLGMGVQILEDRGQFLFAFGNDG